MLTVGASRKEARLVLLPLGDLGEVQVQVQGQSRERLALSERSFAPLTPRMSVLRRCGAGRGTLGCGA